MAASDLENMFTSAFQGLRDMIDVNTVVGTPIELSDGRVIIPVSKVSFGYGMGGFNKDLSLDNQTVSGGSGGGVSVSPVGFLIVEQGSVRMMNVDATTPLEKVIDSLPELIKSVGTLFDK